MTHAPSLSPRSPFGALSGTAEPAETAEVCAETAVAAALDLKQVFSAHYPQVWRLLRRLGVAVAELDDAAQEVFWVVARRQLVIAKGSERAFLYGVALRVAATRHRNQRRTPSLVPSDDALLVDLGQLDPEQALERRQARALLDSVLAGLPQELRTVLVLFELEGLELREIAELEQLPLGTVSSRLRRAKSSPALRDGCAPP